MLRITNKIYGLFWFCICPNFAKLIYLTFLAKPQTDRLCTRPWRTTPSRGNYQESSGYRNTFACRPNSPLFKAPVVCGVRCNVFACKHYGANQSKRNSASAASVYQPCTNANMCPNSTGICSPDRISQSNFQLYSMHHFHWHSAWWYWARIHSNQCVHHRHICLKALIGLNAG